MLYSEIVIVGCGNPLFGDDGFSPVIEEMEKLTLPDNVTIQDGGAGAALYFNFLNPEVTKRLLLSILPISMHHPGSISKCP